MSADFQVAHVLPEHVSADYRGARTLAEITGCYAEPAPFYYRTYLHEQHGAEAR